jgi:hypothetical protein
MIDQWWNRHEAKRPPYRETAHSGDDQGRHTGRIDNEVNATRRNRADGGANVRLLFRVNAVGCAQGLGQIEAAIRSVNNDDCCATADRSAQDGGEADRTGAEDRD